MSTEYKYKPKNLSEFIFATDELEKSVKQYTEGDCLRPLILHGPHGTGKSLLSRVIPEAIDGPSVEITKITAEDLNTKKEVRDRFTRSSVFDKLYSPTYQSRTYTIVEEVNFETKAKGALRVAMDEMAGRDQLIFTTNELDKMDSGLRSRAEQIFVPPLPPEHFFNRAKWILKHEGVELEDSVLMNVLDAVHEKTADIREYYKALDKIIYRTKN